MTNQEVSERYVLRFTGEKYQYLCVPPLGLAGTSAQPNRPSELQLGEDEPVEVPAYDKVWKALPGMIADLVEKTKLNQATVYSVLGKMRKRGQITSMKIDTAPVRYARVAG